MQIMFRGALYTIRFVKGKYKSNGNLYVGIESKDEYGCWEDFCDVTINFPVECNDDCGFLNIPDMPKEVYELIAPNIDKTSRTISNGFIEYPEVRFNKKILNEALDI